MSEEIALFFLLVKVGDAIELRATLQNTFLTVPNQPRSEYVDDIVISIVEFLVLSLRNTDGTVIQGANSSLKNSSLFRKVRSCL
jgi:hypothetical protein